MKRAVLVISHGSRSARTKEEVRQLIGRLKSMAKIDLIEDAYLEIESPSIPEGIAGCAQKGADEIIVLLNFLNAGRHVDVDIPNIISEARKKFPNVKIHLTRPVGQHPRIPELFTDILSPFQK